MPPAPGVNLSLTISDSGAADGLLQRAQRPHPDTPTCSRVAQPPPAGHSDAHQLLHQFCHCCQRCQHRRVVGDPTAAELAACRPAERNNQPTGRGAASEPPSLDPSPWSPSGMVCGHLTLERSAAELVGGASWHIEVLENTNQVRLEDVVHDCGP